ncbi:MAG TPA: YceI family protein [Mycobacterium sp.]|nr:YceI family protein [Mycobacterium sp.]
MAPQQWQLDQSDGHLTIRTGVEGPAAKMGHRLDIAMNIWEATVGWSDGEPAQVNVTVETDSLVVLGGEGGVTPLTGPEKALARSNAVKVLGAKQFPQITFQSDDIERTGTGCRLTGRVQIHGTVRDCVVELRVEELDDAWRLSADVDVRQSDFGVKPYSMMMGAMKVADTVTVSFSAERSRDN